MSAIGLSLSSKTVCEQASEGCKAKGKKGVV